MKHSRLEKMTYSLNWSIGDGNLKFEKLELEASKYLMRPLFQILNIQPSYLCRKIPKISINYVVLKKQAQIFFCVPQNNILMKFGP